MKKSELVKLIREELQGYSPQIGNTKRFDSETLSKILKKIASGEDYEPDGEMDEGDGLWANIRAKRARGEKPAHKNSNAHKDAVKAGKKINKMSERIRVLSPEKQKANDAAFDRRMATLKDLEKGKKLHKAGKISDEELHNLKLKAGTISADSKFTKKEIKGK